MASIVQTTPKRAASGVASGAAAIEARPATAVLRPIIEAEWPRLSRMTLSSGMATPMAMPTTLIEAIAAEIDSQWVRPSAAVSSLDGGVVHAAVGPDKWGFRWRETGWRCQYAWGWARAGPNGVAMSLKI